MFQEVLQFKHVFILCDNKHNIMRISGKVSPLLTWAHFYKINVPKKHTWAHFNLNIFQQIVGTIEPTKDLIIKEMFHFEVAPSGSKKNQTSFAKGEESMKPFFLLL